MRQPGEQVPVWQNRAVPQAVPSASASWAQPPAPSQASPVQALPSSAQAPPGSTFDQALVLLAGSQRWQSLAGLDA